MTKWFIIMVVSLGLCFPNVTCAGTEPPRSSAHLNRVLEQNAPSTRHTGKYFSQNAKKKTSSRITGDGTVKTEEKTTLPKTLKKEKNAQKNTKKLKSFIPSETIPADQGVDFPYDI